ncbi:MAG: TauD/TfdA family dioxygenase [Novosphingobium sp.]|nr:TauD/TfdA family dioxygenase [Novosphingobium sp.]
MPIEVSPLRDDLSFGAKINGVSHDVLRDEAVRERIRQVFDDRGVIVFEKVEPTDAMQMALSSVFGSLKQHPVEGADFDESDDGTGALVNTLDPKDCDIVEIDGKLYSNWLPWHFDHCYTDELNRGGVLRSIEIAPNGGLTGFMDGIVLYDQLPRELREEIESCSIFYSMDMQFDHITYGRPDNFQLVQLDWHWIDIFKQSRTYPRAIHPAVWTRKTGEKVLHISPWMAEGIEGRENDDGDALLEAVSQEINRIGNAQAYFHKWEASDMAIWDNWRFLHRVTGCHPPHRRAASRTTIQGDYGLGRFEQGGRSRDLVLERAAQASSKAGESLS